MIHTGDYDRRQKRIAKVTLAGTFVNCILSVGKLTAGIVGNSAAMVSDAIHSVSDLASDIIILLFVKLSSKGSDRDHDYGHGKYETLATVLVALILAGAGVKLCVNGVKGIISSSHAEGVEIPQAVALWAAVISIISKEILYRVTVKVGKEEDSQAVIANAWHHRSDALSSIGSLLGIGGAIFLGEKWAFLDPLAACIISIMLIVTSLKIACPAIRELLDASLEEEKENEIVSLATKVDGVRNLHELKTRRNGHSTIIDAHLCVDPYITVIKAHDIATEVENVLVSTFGKDTQIFLHIEPYDKN